MARFAVARFRSAALALAVGLSTLGCAPSVAEVALNRAAYDLDCPVDKIQVRPGAGGVVVAEGCDEWVSYGCLRTRGTILCMRDASSLPTPVAR